MGPNTSFHYAGTDYPLLSAADSEVVIMATIFRYLNFLSPHIRATPEGAYMVAMAMATVVAGPEHRAWLRWYNDEAADEAAAEAKWDNDNDPALFVGRIIAATVRERADVEGKTITSEAARIIAKPIADVVTKNAGL